MTPDDVLTTTRSVRRRLDLGRPVPLDLVKECLTIALQAPSASNTQRWHWLVVTDPALRTAIGEVYRRAAHGYLNSPRAAGKLFADDPRRSTIQRRVGASVAYLADRMGQVPVHVIPCIRVSGRRLGGGSQAGLWGSLLPAAWSYMLAARSRGLGTAWTTLHLSYEKQVAELLGVPDDIRQGALIPTAYTIGTEFRLAPREPLASVLHVDGW